MTKPEIIKAAGAVFLGTQEGSSRVGRSFNFEVEDMPGVTMSMFEMAINSAADVKKHIEWKRAQFADTTFLQSQWEKS